MLISVGSWLAPAFSWAEPRESMVHFNPQLPVQCKGWSIHWDVYI